MSASLSAAVRRATEAIAHGIGVVGLLNISKPRGDILIGQLEARLRERLPAVEFRNYAKPTFTKPAPLDLRQKIAEECGFVIEALAD